MENKLDIVVANGFSRLSRECAMLATSTSVQKGYHASLSELGEADYFVCAGKGRELLGFAALANDGIVDNDITILNLCVKKGNNADEVSSNLVEYVVKHSFGRRYVMADVDKEQTELIKVLARVGLKKSYAYDNNVVLWLDTSLVAGNDFLSAEKNLPNFKFTAAEDESQN